jgi:multisubunit Na+/H+ antiporter MnhF subunit
VNAFTIAATALLAGFVPIGIVCVRGRELDGVVALELAGALAAMVFLCLGEGFHRSSYFGVPIVCAALSWVGGMVFVRFFARNDEQEGDV